MRKLHIAANVFAKSPLINLVKSVRSNLVREIPALAYHRIMDVDSSYPFDIGLISATRAAFYQQMEYVKNNYNPISVGELIEYIDKGKALPKRSILVTFDDGFDDNYHIAYPILKNLGIPATIFVATNFINSDRPIWYERLAYFFNAIEPGMVEIPALSMNISVKDSSSQRRSCYCSVIEELKLVDESVRIDMLTRLYEEYGDPYKKISREIKNLSRAMTWDQLNEMAENNIEIGSHTVNHPILSTLPLDQMKHELNESKNMLEKNLEREVSSIAYPVGQEESYSNKVVEEVSEAGYRIAFTYIDGISRLDDLDRYRVNRLHVDLDSTLELFRSKICLPEIFCE